MHCLGARVGLDEIAMAKGAGERCQIRSRLRPHTCTTSLAADDVSPFGQAPTSPRQHLPLAELSASACRSNQGSRSSLCVHHVVSGE